MPISDWLSISSTCAVFALVSSTNCTPASWNGLSVGRQRRALQRRRRWLACAYPDLSVNQSIQARAAALCFEWMLMACW